MLHQEVLAGRFEVGSEAASGGMGDIYRGRDLQTSSPVAVKLLTPPSSTEAARFAREAALLAEVSHPGIVRYLAHGATTDGRTPRARAITFGGTPCSQRRRTCSSPRGFGSTRRHGGRLLQFEVSLPAGHHVHIAAHSSRSLRTPRSSGRTKKQGASFV